MLGILVSLSWHSTKQLACTLRAGDVVEAERAYRKGLGLSPRDEDVYSKLVNVMLRRGKRKEAAKLCEELVYLLASRTGEARDCGERFYLEAANIFHLIEDYRTSARLLLMSSRVCYPSPRSLVAFAQILMRSNSHALAVQALMAAGRMFRLHRGARSEELEEEEDEGTSPRDGKTATGSREDPVLAVELLCNLMLSLQRSSFWVYHHFPLIEFDSNLTRPSTSDVFLSCWPNVLTCCFGDEFCTSATHAGEIGLSVEQTKVLAEENAKKHLREVQMLYNSSFALHSLDFTLMSTRKLRIGYLSGTGFHASTTTANFIVGVLKSHDRRHVVVHCLALAGDDGSMVVSLTLLRNEGQDGDQQILLRVC
ncbi:hypothetical protein GUITHDRAFT_147183 [Guillardia theta CCMP2712]|uniref:O-GlcNAc transferase C-terminal domain-containing protein n=1 Tax=Guillardia theta (strain CCMP2712) TaxID=905079 RepID=L1IEY5_GUITC|nr:hypothetical protein GUITHDRAFT_147183 [Guillardia theta CCMP2712]EKX34484.1 hypothetical protein GUITHDRAFT_147183 [Guillardia theta CCMP2712]|eukprot:XP_005821464.1 hypothetical protein GUITHDRAFT_147183 [Guillardia theta CCMP2712]